VWSLNEKANNPLGGNKENRLSKTSSGAAPAPITPIAVIILY
jgi:hypothetical protein